MPIDASRMRTLNTGFKALFGETFNQTATLAEDIATRIDSSDLQETYPWLGDIPDMKEWVGARDVKELSDFSYTLQNKKYESTVSVPKEYIEYDKAGIFAPAIKMMAERARKFGEKLLVDLLLNGTTNLCYDGKAFFADDHAVGSNTYDNKTTLTLTEDHLNAAYDFMLSIKNDQDRALGVTPNILITGPQLRATAKKLVSLDGNGTNSTFELVKPVVIPEITGTKWFLLDTTKAIRPFILQVAKDGIFETNDDDLFSKGLVQYGTESFMNAGYSLWQLAYYSDGTGA